MPIEELPDELVHRIVIELHSSIAVDKAFYVSRRRKAGIHWTHVHLAPISTINKQFRRVALPTLFESVDIVVQDYGGDSFKQYSRDVERFIKSASLRSDFASAIR
jgi:hypothetical protein